MPDLTEIIGQPAAIRRLEGTLTGQRMPHAFIFAGPEGVGRRTTALALASTLLCEHARSGGAPLLADTASAHDAAPRACGQCADCSMVAAGTHPDVNLVYKELAAYHPDTKVRDRVMQDLGIGVIRHFLIAPAFQSASRGRGKVFIVLESELMSAAAQNALLKTLEEPPPGVTIVLVTRRPELMLPTTLSRCAMIRFGPLPREFVIGKLADGGIDPPEAAFWAAFTNGSIGRSLRLAERGLYEIKRTMIERVVTAATEGDPELGDHLVKTADSLASAAVKESKRDDGTEMSANLARRQATGVMLELIAGAYRDALHVHCGIAEADGDLIHGDQADAVRALAGRFDEIELADILEQLSEYERLLWRNVNAKTVWDNVAITCTSAAPLEV